MVTLGIKYQNRAKSREYQYHNTVQGYNVFEVAMYIKAGCSIHSTYWNMGMPTGYELKRIKL